MGIRLGFKGWSKDYEGCSLRYKIDRFFWEIRYAWQRAWRGYSYPDVFNFDTNMEDRFIVLMQEYKDNLHSLLNKPEHLVDKSLGIDGYSHTEEETHAILEKMIELAKAAQYDWDADLSFSSTEEYLEYGRKIKRTRAELFNLLNDYWGGLWD